MKQHDRSGHDGTSLGSAATAPEDIRLSTRASIATAVAVALVTSVIAAIKYNELGYPNDFSYWWVAARALLAGQDPYAVIKPGGPFKFDNVFMYPLPAALVTIPLAGIRVFPAGMIFSAIGMGLLTFGLARTGWQRWPILMSFPCLWCVSSGQWSTFIAAAALLPACGWVAACKPTLGLAAFVYRPRWSFVIGAALLAVLSLIVMPAWPLHWLATTRLTPPSTYHVPVLTSGGVLLLLAVLRWRRSDARLLLVMSCIPQTMFVYDQLPLLLLARTRKQALVISLLSYLLIWGARFVGQGPVAESKADTLDYLAEVITWTFYLPLLVVVLRRPNEGVIGARLERLAERLPGWLRGTTAGDAKPQSVIGAT